MRVNAKINVVCRFDDEYTPTIETADALYDKVGDTVREAKLHDLPESLGVIEFQQANELEARVHAYLEEHAGEGFQGGEFLSSEYWVFHNPFKVVWYSTYAVNESSGGPVEVFAGESVGTIGVIVTMDRDGVA